MYNKYLSMILTLILTFSLISGICTSAAVSNGEYPVNLKLGLNETFNLCLNSYDEIHYDKNYVKVIYPWCGTYPICIGIQALKAGKTTISITNNKTHTLRQYNLTITPNITKI